MMVTFQGTSIKNLWSAVVDRRKGDYPPNNFN